MKASQTTAASVDDGPGVTKLSLQSPGPSSHGRMTGADRGFETPTSKSSGHVSASQAVGGGGGGGGGGWGRSPTSSPTNKQTTAVGAAGDGSSPSSSSSSNKANSRSPSLDDSHSHLLLQQAAVDDAMAMERRPRQGSSTSKQPATAAGLTGLAPEQSAQPANLSAAAQVGR